MNLRKLLMAQKAHERWLHHFLQRKKLILAEMTNYPSTAEGKKNSLQFQVVKLLNKIW